MPNQFCVPENGPIPARNIVVVVVILLFAAVLLYAGFAPAVTVGVTGSIAAIGAGLVLRLTGKA
jgi:hypothetical protein